MEATTETLAMISALEPVDSLCVACREHATMRVIVLPPAVVAARASRPVHISAFRTVGKDDDDLESATWEDAAWQ